MLIQSIIKIKNKKNNKNKNVIEVYKDNKAFVSRDKGFIRYNVILTRLNVVLVIIQVIEKLQLYYNTHLCRENLLVGMGNVLANLLASWLDLNWD